MLQFVIQQPNIRRRERKSKTQEFNAYFRCALVINKNQLFIKHTNVEEKLNIDNKRDIPFEKQNVAMQPHASKDIGMSPCPRKADSIKMVILFIMAFSCIR